MLKRITVASALFLFIASSALDCLAQASSSGSSSEVAAAAKKFLGLLDDTLRGKAVYEFKDETQRKRWSNLPTSFVKRGGLRMGDLSKAQRDAAMGVIAAALSPQGYEKVVQIVQGDEMLKTNDRGGGGGGAPMFGRDEYYISFLGQPSTADPWMIQFGGHHLGINITFVGENATMAPSHTGSQPAIYEFEGKTVRPLGHETDKAFALINDMTEPQRKQAILGVQVRDLVLGPGRDGQTIQPEGVKASELNDKQRDMLLDLASEWTGILGDAAAKAKMEDLKKHVTETWFAWSGPTEKGKAAYFRIQGPTVVIEYAPQRLGGDLTKHIHTIYRDPSNEYGMKWIKP